MNFLNKKKNKEENNGLPSLALSLSTPNPTQKSLLKMIDYNIKKLGKKPQLLGAPNLGDNSLSIPLSTISCRNPNPKLHFDNLNVAGIKLPRFSLSFFHLAPNPNPNPNFKPNMDLSIVGPTDPSLSLSLSPPNSNPNPNPKPNLKPNMKLSIVGPSTDPSLSLSLSPPNPNPNPNPKQVVLGVKRALPIDVKVKVKTVKRARTTVRIPRRNIPLILPRIPVEFRQKMMELGGAHHLKMVLEKTLFATDVNPVNARLTLPRRQCTVELTDDEIYNTVVGFEVMVMEPDCGVRKMSFRRWDTVNSYVLVSKWNNVVQDNGLEQGDTLQIWSFRYGPRDHLGRLGFALVKLNRVVR